MGNRAIVSFCVFLPSLILTKELCDLWRRGNSISTQDHETLNNAEFINYIQLLLWLSQFKIHLYKIVTFVILSLCVLAVTAGKQLQTGTQNCANKCQWNIG
jgi:hypothetical protein